MKAIALFDKQIQGVVEFSQSDPKGHLTIRFKLSGFQSNSIHAIHIHEFGDLREGCKTLGGHFNPMNKKHSHYGRGHAGDLFNNLMSDKYGDFVYIMRTNQLSLFYGDKCIIGRSVVIHEFADDYGLQGLYLRESEESKPMEGVFVYYDEMDVDELRDICEKLGYDEANKTRKDMVARLNKESIASGNASKRIACAIIGLSK